MADDASRGDAGAGLAAPAEYQADPSWRAIDLLSDVHLSADAPATFKAWSTHLRHTDADAVFLLGDLFEVWVGDDARHGGFEAQCLSVLRETAQRLRGFAFMAGNRDFLVGQATLEDAGMRWLADPTVLVAFGVRTLLTHGDAWCLADREYQRFRAEVRSVEWQEAFLRRPLSERREIARGMRDASRRRQRALAGSGSADVDVDSETALDCMRLSNATRLVHGHTHRPGSETLESGFTRHVLSDWDFDHCAPPRGDVLRLTPAGARRMAPLAAA